MVDMGFLGCTIDVKWHIVLRVTRVAELGTEITPLQNAGFGDLDILEKFRSGSEKVSNISRGLKTMPYLEYIPITKS